MRFTLPPREQIGRDVSAEMYDLLVRGLSIAPDNRTLDLERLALWAGPIELGAS
jgi:hypothetical protein